MAEKDIEVEVEELTQRLKAMEEEMPGRTTSTSTTKQAVTRRLQTSTNTARRLQKRHVGRMGDPLSTLHRDKPVETSNKTNKPLAQPSRQFTWTSSIKQSAEIPVCAHRINQSLEQTTIH